MTRLEQQQETDLHDRFDAVLDRCYKDGANPDDLREIADLHGHTWHVPVLMDRYSRELFDWHF